MPLCRVCFAPLSYPLLQQCSPSPNLCCFCSGKCVRVPNTTGLSNLLRQVRSFATHRPRRLSPVRPLIYLSVAVNRANCACACLLLNINLCMPCLPKISLLHDQRLTLIVRNCTSRERMTSTTTATSDEPGCDGEYLCLAWAWGSHR